MSKVAIEGNESGTGTFTIAAPDSNTSRTLTLPDAAGTFDTLQRAGNLLQVVHGTATTETTNSTTTYVDTTLTATITPTSATSKVLIFVSQNYYRSGTPSGLAIKLFRGATDLGRFGDNIGDGASAAVIDRGIAAFQTLDTPSTTSPVTYKTQFANKAATSFVRVQGNGVNGPSHITLMEIAA